MSGNKRAIPRGKDDGSLHWTRAVCWFVACWLSRCKREPFIVSISSSMSFFSVLPVIFLRMRFSSLFFSSSLGGERESVVCAGYGDGGIWISSVACELRFSSVRRTACGNVDDGLWVWIWVSCLDPLRLLRRRYGWRTEMDDTLFLLLEEHWWIS